MNLKEYLNKKGETVYSISRKDGWKELGTERHIYRWAEGICIPNVKNMKIICHDLTDNLVDPNSFFIKAWERMEKDNEQK
tara:strand:+ start:336 stop:575 length:240 start_codon:yes stop_codon:yes gene_type:complete